MKTISIFALALSVALAYGPAYAVTEPEAAAKSEKHDEHEHEGHEQGHDKEEKTEEHDKHEHESHEEGDHHGAQQAMKNPKAKTAAAAEPVEKHEDHDAHEHGGKKEKEDSEHDEEGHEHGHEEGGHEEAGASVGPGMAVEAYEEGKRIKLSEKAIARLGIKTSKPKAASSGLVVPVVALVHVEGETFLFVSKAGWYEKRKVTVAAKENEQAFITKGIAANDQVVTAGAASIRVTELDLSAGDEVGHGH